MKYKNREPSLANTFGTLYTSSFFLLVCNFHSHRFGEQPSHVSPNTQKPNLSNLETAPHTGSNIKSPLILPQANYAYG